MAAVVIRIQMIERSCVIWLGQDIRVSTGYQVAAVDVDRSFFYTTAKCHSSHVATAFVFATHSFTTRQDSGHTLHNPHEAS